MKILFFSMPYPSFLKSAKGYNGGGWVGSLIQKLKSVEDLELSISFNSIDGDEPYIKDGVHYYPMLKKTNRLDKVLERITKSPEKRDEELVAKCVDVVEQVKPDVIHLFGSESAFGLLAEHTNVPVVLHIQGIISPYRMALLPPGMSWKEAAIGQKVKFWAKRQQKAWKLSSEREQRIFKAVPHFIGRTDFDHILQQVLNPNATYHYVAEVLREPFYETLDRIIPQKLKIVSTISYFVYKGYDNILKTADVLQKHYGDNYEWVVFGNVNTLPAEAVTGLKTTDCNIILRGVAKAEEIKKELLSATLYYHPSYIDNSPNSICEAQILGIPVIAQNVGGVASLVEHNNTGILIPANDPYQGAYWINYLYTSKKENLRIGDNAKKEAKRRHDKDAVCSQLVECYESILNK